MATDYTHEVIKGCTVLEKTDARDHGQVVWKCKCDCGKEFTATSSRLCRALKLNRVVSCEDCDKRPAYIYAVPGSTIASFSIIDKIKVKTYSNGKYLYKYNCKCNVCNKEFTMSQTAINSHKRDSALECIHNHRAKDLTNMVFDGFEAIEPTTKRYHGYIVWKCRCSCGKIFEAPYVNIISGNTKSCGHLFKQNKKRFKKDNRKNGKNRINTMRYDTTNSYGIGYTRSDQRFLFDMEDFDKITAHSWRVNGNHNNSLISQITTADHHKKKMYLLNTILDIPEDKHIKKIIFKNGDRFDFRKENVEVLFKQR